MNIDFIVRYWPLYTEAMKLTLRMAVIGIVLSLVVGFICCVLIYYKVPVLRNIVYVYIELSRNTPLLIQLFFLYFGLPKIGIMWSQETCAIVGLTFLGGSYMAEAFRSGFETIDKVQKESGMALGFNNRQILVHIILPGALEVALPAIIANVIFMVKETSVFSVVALPDLMYVAKDLIGLYYQTDEALLMLVISYLIILLPISLLGTLAERRIRYGRFGN